ncbi:MAG: hypothetical protein ACPHQT_01600 [Planctomycetota bacterium]
MKRLPLLLMTMAMILALWMFIDVGRDHDRIGPDLTNPSEGSLELIQSESAAESSGNSGNQIFEENESADPSGPVTPTPKPSAVSTLRSGPWSEPLQRLIEKGKYSSDVAQELTNLFECQNGIGDQLLQLLAEGQGTLYEKRALLVALGTALSMDPIPSGIWIDRRGVLEWAVDLWIEGLEDFGHLDRWFDSTMGIDGNLSFSLIDDFLSEPEKYSEESAIRTRWREVVLRGLQSEMSQKTPPWLEQWTLDWLESDDAEFQKIAQGIVAHLYSSEDFSFRQKVLSRIGTRDIPTQLEVGKGILLQADGEQLAAVLDEWADFFIRNEYRGSELLTAFHRAREQRLKPLLYRRGDDARSESYRLWVLYGALGGRDSSGTYPLEWMQTLDETARLDPSQGVRFLALRLCAMGWGQRSEEEWTALAQLSGVNPEQLNQAHGLFHGTREKFNGPGEEE